MQNGARRRIDHESNAAALVLQQQVRRARALQRIGAELAARVDVAREERASDVDVRDRLKAVAVEEAILDRAVAALGDAPPVRVEVVVGTHAGRRRHRREMTAAVIEIRRHARARRSGEALAGGGIRVGGTVHRQHAILRVNHRRAIGAIAVRVVGIGRDVGAVLAHAGKAAADVVVVVPRRAVLDLVDDPRERVVGERHVEHVAAGALRPVRRELAERRVREALRRVHDVDAGDEPRRALAPHRDGPGLRDEAVVIVAVLDRARADLLASAAEHAVIREGHRAGRRSGGGDAAHEQSVVVDRQR